MNQSIVTNKIVLLSFFLTLVQLTFQARAQQVPVTFSYYNDTINAAELRSEFTDWGPIGSRMSQIRTGHFIKTVNLNVNGGTYSQNGDRAYNYKFWSLKDGWTSDPLNPIINSSDNNNSLVFVKMPNDFSALYFKQYINHRFTRICFQCNPNFCNL